MTDPKCPKCEYLIDTSHNLRACPNCGTGLPSHIEESNPSFFRSQPIAILVGFVVSVILWGGMVNLLPVLFRNDVPQIMLAILTIGVWIGTYKIVKKD